MTLKVKVIEPSKAKRLRLWAQKGRSLVFNAQSLVYVTGSRWRSYQGDEHNETDVSASVLRGLSLDWTNAIFVQPWSGRHEWPLSMEVLGGLVHLREFWWSQRKVIKKVIKKKVIWKTNPRTEPLPTPFRVTVQESFCQSELECRYLPHPLPVFGMRRNEVL